MGYNDDGESSGAGGIITGGQTAAPAHVELGADIVLLIAGLLAPQDLVSANQVCRTWRSALTDSSALWREHAADLREWDGGLGPRERVLRHVRTERAWATGRARTTTHSVGYMLADWMDFKLDAGSGLALMAVRGGAALVDTRSWTTARMLTDDEWLNVNLFPGTLALTDAEAMTIEVFGVVRRVDGGVELVSQHKFHVSTTTAVMTLNTVTGASAAVVSHVPKVEEDGPHKLSIHVAPDWATAHEHEVEPYVVSALDDANVSTEV
ncbi:uncharacterized protein LOC62_03G005164 [Vanrija pseudolonga]|uniref:F-box domain-containing protein n=1 Tax=Vanrija pseudolonga TaxID=143232 RepID=A0AAF1BHX4_9TREE|nr:hypothetical protein LOC62_03G005164 [Vanrija pseudolonga]